MIKLFVYGTLQFPNVQKQVIGREVPALSDILKGFKSDRIIINGKGYPAAIRAAGNEIEGKVLEVTEAELRVIDEYETKAYQRIKVSLTSGIKAWVYIKL